MPTGAGTTTMMMALRIPPLPWRLLGRQSLLLRTRQQQQPQTRITRWSNNRRSHFLVASGGCSSVPYGYQSLLLRGCCKNYDLRRRCIYHHHHHRHSRSEFIAFRYSSLSSSCHFSSSPFSTAATTVTTKQDGNGGGLFRLLNDDERALLEEQRRLTEQTRLVAQNVGLATMRDYSTGVLNDSSTFAVVIAGEYNAGKSTLINALVGEKLLETGSLPTTDCITILSYDNDDNDGSSSHSDVSSSDVQQQQPQPQPPMENSSSRNSSGVVHYRVALPLLQDLTVVDTPGTNAVVKDHTVLTLRLLPSADLILFVTSADRPFPESERALLESIAVHYRKSIVVVINKMDVLDDSGGIHGMVEKQKVIDFVTEHASALLGARPIVLAISARDALAAKLTGQAAKESAVWKRSNFAALERFLRDTLTTETKIKSKLSSPIGVAEGLLDECRQKLQQDKRELETDISTLNLLHSQFAAWRKETTADMDAAANEIQIVLEQQGARGSLLLRRMSLLDFYYTTVDDMPLRHEWFQTRPLARTYMYSSFPSQHPPQQHRQPHTNNTVQSELLERVQETADSIAIRGRAQGQAVIEFLGKRPAVRNQSLVGSVTAASRFEDVRKHLVETLSQAVIRNLNDVDDTVEEDLLLKRLQQTAWLSAALNAGSLGLVAAVATQQLDVLPGVTSFAALAISSAFCVQVGRTRLVQQYADRWARRSQRLDEDITTIGAKEADRVDRKIRDGVAPYTRFVQAEQERIDQQLDLCEELTASAQRLRKRINNLRL